MRPSKGHRRRPRATPQSRAAIAFLVAAGLTGGASAFDEFAQLLVRLAAVAALIYGLVVMAPPRFAGRRAPVVILGLAALLVAVQLVPLPPSMWHALPGRTLFANGAMPLVADGWRPLHLSPDRGYNALFSLLVPAAMLVLAAHLTREELARLIVPLALLVLASAVLGLMQLPLPRLSLFAGHSEASPVGLFANRNHQALFLAIGISVFLAIGLRADFTNLSARARMFAVPAVLVLLLLLILATGSRAGLGLAALSILLSVTLFWRDLRGGWRDLGRRSRRVAASGGVVLVLGVVAVLVTMGRAASLDRLAQVDIAGDLRSRTLPAVLEMLNSYFPVGAGFGAFNPAFRRFETVDLLSTIVFNQAHDDYMQIAIEGGLPGLLLLAAGLGWFAVRAVAALRGPMASPGDVAARVGVIAVTLIAVASIVDYPARTPFIMALLALSAAWLMPPARRRAAA